MTNTSAVAPAITVEELIDELRAHSPSAFVRFEGEDGGALGNVVRTFRDRDVVVQLEVADDLGDADDAADDEDWDNEPIVEARWRARLRGDAWQFHNGLDSGYPLCCIAFFLYVWGPLGRFSRVPRTGRTERLRHRLIRGRDRWADGRCTEQIPCPWHRWISAGAVVRGDV